jgi:hypothetical protein
VSETTFYKSRPLRTSINCVTILLMRLLNITILCVCDFIMKIYSTLVMLCFSGDYIVRIFFFTFMLQLLSVTPLLELEAFHNCS